MIAKLRRVTAGLLVVCIAGLGMPLPAHAGMIGTEATLATGERQRIVQFLERAEVREQLVARGVNPADVKDRIAALTDEEAAALAADIDGLPAGGDVLGVLLIVFLVLLLTDIMGFTKVFPFTRPVR